MRVLYKYYSGLNANYFENPTLKLTSAYNLNDPFEVALANELLSLAEEANKDDKSFQRFKELLGSGSLKEGYNKLIKMCGIISLSETQHNLLMWSHYADQHRGMCIGYDSSLLSKRDFKREYKRLPLIKNPIKIDYDTKKNNFQNGDFDNLSGDKLEKQILTKQLTTKGNDWIYEKEHRLIIPIGRADKFIFRGSRSVTSGSNQNIPEEFEKHIERTSENEYKITSGSDAIANKLADNSRYTFLLNIDKEHIKNVYLGCRMPVRTANKIINQINGDAELSHVKIYKYKESLDRFELEETPS